MLRFVAELRCSVKNVMHYINIAKIITEHFTQKYVSNLKPEINIRQRSGYFWELGYGPEIF
jgi:hypothetical protein